MAESLDKYRERDGVPRELYLRFKPLVDGSPVRGRFAFEAFRFEPAMSASWAVAATPDPGDTVIAVFDEAGRELESNVDELGSPGRIARWYEKGRLYWIACGRRGGGGGFSLGLRQGR
jgi:hypothetical protein